MKKHRPKAHIHARTRMKIRNKNEGQTCHFTGNKICHLILAQFSFLFFNFNSKAKLKLGLKIRIQKIKQGSNPSFQAKQNNNLTEHNGLSFSLSLPFLEFQLPKRVQPLIIGHVYRPHRPHHPHSRPI